VARLAAGKNLLSPRILIDRRLDRLSERGKETVTTRLDLWLRHQVERWLAALRAAGLAAQDPSCPAEVRSILAMLVDEGGIVARAAVAKPLGALEREQRRLITRLKVKIGALDLFIPDMLKPEPRRWRSALRAAASGGAMPELPPESAVVLPAPREEERGSLAKLGFRAVGLQMVRVDLAERLARHAFEARGAGGRPLVDEALTTSLGLQPQAVTRLMRDLGFRPSETEAGWVWRGRDRRQRPDRGAAGSGAFAALASLKRG
jgi:ATP-dependent RNA helicase SUPV3L1/SUV3